MSPVDIILASTVVLLTLGCMMHILVSRTRLERAENGVELNQRDIKNLLNAAKDPELTNHYVEMHRKLETLQTVVEAQGLRLTDVSDTLEHRYNRLRMRQNRAQQEGEVQEPEVDPETQLQLLQDLNGAQDPEPQQPTRRGRLVPRHRRDKYTRR